MRAVAGALNAVAVGPDGSRPALTRSGRGRLQAGYYLGDVAGAGPDKIEDDPSTFNGSPAVSGGRLFLRSDKYLYCVGKGK